ncbi:acyl-CoA thioesterase [Kroppenstedtia pulmonis]|uniref:Acyl-CoA thioesterase n=1 Tax=Kroppenstedtia pulmonis TaxID=1380685 RepID=A0A7D4C5P0_9BACL|nr:thioesterase family protein [Kroppenstedtia pulmonis]QKG83956.1 acyl-CoA thioesterase [Kroppenstedtia pulmonis]
MDETKNITQLQVRYEETDQMGVVHHSKYAVWFEVGRTQMIRQLGYSYGDLEKRGILLPVVDLQCRFVSPARYEDQVQVITQVSEARGPKLAFSYEIRHAGDDTLIAKGSTVHLWVNADMKRINLKRVAPDVYDVVTGCLSDR